MNCQSYRKSISDAALGMLNASPLAELRIHLTACPECRDRFEAEQRLFAAIDRGVRASVEGTPSADFLAGVRIRLAEERQPVRFRTWWRPAVWSPALALVALAVLILTLWFARRPPRPRVPERVRSTVPAAPAQNPQLPQQMAVVVRPKAGSPTARPHRSASLSTHRPELPRSSESDQSPQLEVLVDPGQKAALAELVRTMHRGADPVGRFEKSVQNEDPLQVQAVQVDAVTVAELQTPKPIGSAADEGKSQ